jgi:hypothetical protein
MHPVGRLQSCQDFGARLCEPQRHGRKRRVEFSRRSVSSRAAAGRRPALLWLRLRRLVDSVALPTPEGSGVHCASSLRRILSPKPCATNGLNDVLNPLRGGIGAKLDEADELLLIRRELLRLSGECVYVAAFCSQAFQQVSFPASQEITRS